MLGFYSLVVKPLEDIVYTARNMLLDDFVKMSEAADLTDQLSNEGAYTVFIPENEAFQKLTDKERYVIYGRGLKVKV